MLVLAQSDAATGLQSALIAAAVSLLVAVLGALASARKDRLDRQYQRRRTALLDVQDAALSLRQALRDYGVLVRSNPGRRPPEVAVAERQFDHAAGLVEVTRSRVDDVTVVDRVDRWRALAQVAFISVEDDVSLPQEFQAWQSLNVAVGQALQSPKGISTEPERVRQASAAAGRG